MRCVTLRFAASSRVGAAATLPPALQSRRWATTTQQPPQPQQQQQQESNAKKQDESMLKDVDRSAEKDAQRSDSLPGHEGAVGADDTMRSDPNKQNQQVPPAGQQQFDTSKQTDKK